MIALIQRHPFGFAGLLIVIAIVLFVTQYRSNSFFTYEGVTLGMTPAQVKQALPNAGKFQNIKIYDHTSDATLEFEILEAKEKPAPWSRLMIVAVDGKAVSISTFVNNISGEQVDQLRAEMISLFGRPDDILEAESEYGSDTLVWGNVAFEEKDRRQWVKKIHGRAIIYRSNSPNMASKYKVSGSAKLYITEDGVGPNFFF